MEILAYFSILLWAIIVRVHFCSAQETRFDVTTFGAVGDGKTDDSNGFNKMWAAACEKAAESVKISVPNGKTFLVSALEFGGPCKSRHLIFEILGSIVAQPKRAWTNKNKNKSAWLKFEGVDGLAVVGNGLGLIDGQGDSWWHSGNGSRPIAMSFVGCNNLEIMGLKHKNSQKFHLSVSDCNNATLSRLHMVAPPNSPNTDGIDILSSTNINIHNCIIETGDDCIAIKGGTSNMNISEIACGPGHGISIGSLGQGGKHDEVESIHIYNSNITGTTNGVRIKTWQGGSGFARNISFSNILFTMVNNPIIIDQFYCPHKTCSIQESAVKVSDVRLIGLVGTSEPKNPAITFRCSDVVPCTNIIVDGVDIKTSDESKTVAVCLNAFGIARNVTSPPLDCLRK